MKWKLMPLAVFLSACGMKQAEVRDQERAQMLMKSKREQVNQCYETARRQNSELNEGRILIRATKKDDGSFDQPRTLYSFPHSGGLVECLKKEIQSWKVDNFETRGMIDFEWSFEGPKLVDSE